VSPFDDESACNRPNHNETTDDNKHSPSAINPSRLEAVSQLGKGQQLYEQ
jgi:hypothetical protein